METFGKFLSQQRELRALSRTEVARITRLPLEHILALEEDRFDELPGDAFAIGFIRTYSRCIGIDADEAVLRFKEQRGALPPEPASRHPSRLRARLILPALLLAGVFAAGLAALILRS